jgi:hypothetical protein
VAPEELESSSASDAADAAAELQSRMADELGKFGEILSTGSTGRPFLTQIPAQMHCLNAFLPIRVCPAIGEPSKSTGLLSCSFHWSWKKTVSV